MTYTLRQAFLEEGRETLVVTEKLPDEQTARTRARDLQKHMNEVGYTKNDVRITLRSYHGQNIDYNLEEKIDA